MSAPVDVLAVLDGYCALSPEMQRARVAVAELIEAAAVTLAEPWEIDRLRAALARVQGGAA